MKIKMLLLCLVPFITLVSKTCAVDYASDASVQLFQQYVRINTTTNGDLTPAVEFWTNLAAGQNLTIDKYEFATGYPVLVIEWPGTNSSLPGIMLNSHMDVVPAEAVDWTYDPFAATIDENGDIWGRGTQDMKSVSIQYFEALRKLKEDGVELLRNVYMTLMPDEEVGGGNGMIQFKTSDEFLAMNVGVELDEGSPFPLAIFPMFYQDKAVWQFEVTCYGAASHSATFPATNTTAVGKCRNVIDTFLNFRDEQHEISVNATILNAGAFTAVNLNKINAGTANNIVPQEMTLTFDIRLGTSVNVTEFEAQIEKWLAAAGDNITLTFISKDEQSAEVVHDNTNPYYVAIQTAASNLGMTIYPIVSPGATDARHLRLVDVPAFGFSPMNNTEVLLHAVDERLNAAVFLQGIDIYYGMIQELANLPASSTEGVTGSSLVIQSDE